MKQKQCYQFPLLGHWNHLQSSVLINSTGWTSLRIIQLACLLEFLRINSSKWIFWVNRSAYLYGFCQTALQRQIGSYFLQQPLWGRACHTKYDEPGFVKPVAKIWKSVAEPRERTVREVTGRKGTGSGIPTSCQSLPLSDSQSLLCISGKNHTRLDVHPVLLMRTEDWRLFQCNWCSCLIDWETV